MRKIFLTPKLKNLLFLISLITLLLTAFHFLGTETPAARLSVGLFFSAIVWLRAGEEDVRLLILGILWAGIIAGLLLL
ncbi:MAG TPA: hypothetical protein ENJ29_01420 [Bacteroidetes bacterium]|nr:hypothetical protein [Bacteroidota bacterium]